LIKNIEAINAKAGYTANFSAGMYPSPRAEKNVPKKKKTPYTIVDLLEVSVSTVFQKPSEFEAIPRIQEMPCKNQSLDLNRLRNTWKVPLTALAQEVKRGRN